MNRLNLAACRTTVARVLGTCTTDSRVKDYTNEAQERLMPKGKWVGTVVRYRFCQSSSCITLPRQIETVEGWALCSTPYVIRNQWYEFIGNAVGQQKEDLGSPTQLIDRGMACCFNDPSGANSKINVLASVAEAAAARILLQGYDENWAWIRTQDAGAWIEGEYVAINNTGTRSTKTFKQLTGVVKPVTNGPVDLYEWPVALGSNFQQLAHYENDETLPVYRRYMVPNIANVAACEDAGDECASKTVTIIAKLRHVPVNNDNDWLILGNLPAIKLMVQAILKEEKNLFAEAMAYEAKAIGELQSELSSFEGDGVVPVMRFQADGIFGGSTENDISTNFAWART